jgi:hypothetical protein
MMRLADLKHLGIERFCLFNIIRVMSKRQNIKVG